MVAPRAPGAQAQQTPASFGASTQAVPFARHRPTVTNPAQCPSVVTQGAPTRGRQALPTGAKERSQSMPQTPRTQVAMPPRAGGVQSLGVTQAPCENVMNMQSRRGVRYCMAAGTRRSTCTTAHGNESAMEVGARYRRELQRGSVVATRYVLLGAVLVQM